MITEHVLEWHRTTVRFVGVACLMLGGCIGFVIGIITSMIFGGIT